MLPPQLLPIRRQQSCDELTTLLIPGENDSPEEMNKMTEWIVENLGPDVPLHFSAFHPDWKMRDIEFTPHSTLSRSRGNGDIKHPST